MVDPQTVKKVDGEGMPKLSHELMDKLKNVSDLAKGDLYIKFDIRFPKKILTKYKEEIISILQEN